MNYMHSYIGDHLQELHLAEGHMICISMCILCTNSMCVHNGELVIYADTGVEDPLIEELYNCVYADFVEEIDAVDNGISDRSGTIRYVRTYACM